MLRIPVKGRTIHQNLRLKSTNSSNFIRSTFIKYFVESHGHKHVKSSPVVPLCDSTVPFVNAGMNQFKGVLLGKVDPPCPRAVNSQKCIRVGGKHNDLEVVGSDGHHHTFFEMLGNWSFGDFYKKEACQMAWDLLLGPYRLKPDNLVVTYFAGDVVIGLPEDRECRDIWRAIGVPESRLRALSAKDNFWEMGASGPCGPCTEIHHVNPDGSLTEIWNLVFIQCNRESDGSVVALQRQHVDTGMGLERMAALLQNVPSNYDTDLFRPIIAAIEKHSKGVSPYAGKYGPDAVLDSAYRRLADHARMISVCLADGVFPASSLNLKQIMRKSFKISSDVFQNPQLLTHLYQEVSNTLGSTYPELLAKVSDAKLIIQHEEDAYAKMRAGLAKKWKDLVKRYPEVEEMGDVEMAGFAQGYKEFKEVMSKHNSSTVPGELVFKLYDTYGFQEDLIDRIAALNNLGLDRKVFSKLLLEHKTRHKAAFKEQSSTRGLLFHNAIEKIIKDGCKSTKDQHKYDYTAVANKIQFKPLKTKLVAILNEDCEWIDVLDPCEDRPYYLVAEDSNFYCEEGGQVADSGVIHVNKNMYLKVDSVFKIRDFVFHKGYFKVSKDVESNYVNNNSDVVLEIDGDRRLNIMRNHTGVHLLNAAVRKVLPGSVVCPTGSSVTDKGLYLNLSVYGEKLSQKVILDAQELIRESIKCDMPIETRVVDGLDVSREADVVTIPGETYPEVGLRLVTVPPPPLQSKELCCGTHVPSTGFVQEFCVTLVKGAGGRTPTVHALTGARAKQVRELYCHTQKLGEVIDLVSPERRREEVGRIRAALGALCGGGAPRGEPALCLGLLDQLEKREVNTNDLALQAVAETEVREACEEAASAGRSFVVHFLRCSYLMQRSGLASALASAPASAPALLLGCAGGDILAACRLPKDKVTETFNAERWLRCILPVFHADIKPGPSPLTYAEMTATKVSLINCEQLVQDAMRVAIKYAQAQLKATNERTRHHDTQNRQQN